jgi:hypothetical protein
MVWRRQEEVILLVWSFPPFWLKKPMFQNFPVAACNQAAINSFFMSPYLHCRPADHDRSPMFKMANGRIFLILII